MKNPAYFWRKGIWALSSLVFLFFISMAVLYVYIENQLPDVEALKTVKLQVPLQVFTKDGLLIQEYGEKKRIPLEYKQIPPMLINAILVTEDQRYFEHPGVDVFGLGRAAIRMLKTGTKSQGGSTITMQLARNFFLNREKTFLRKFNEIMLAIKIDHELSKEKILELYLNVIYLGNRAYGVGAAAQVYYGKPLNQLNLAQLATIAGLPQAPSAHNPIANPRAAIKRRNHVLFRLLEEKEITQAQYDEAIQQPISAAYHQTQLQASAPYVAEMIRQSLVQHFGQNAYTQGYKVYTTIQSSLQNAANQIVENHLLAYDKRHGYRGPAGHISLKANEKINLSHSEVVIPWSKYPEINDLVPAYVSSITSTEAHLLLKDDSETTLHWKGMSWAKPALRRGWVGRSPRKVSDIMNPGDIVYIRFNNNQWELTQVPQAESALVSINPQNGAIEALVGGVNFQKSKFNRVTQSGRQPGSSFKPFVYAAALNKGYSLASLVNDAPIVVDDPSQPNLWRPHNVNHTFNGPTRLKEALMSSRNLVSIRILDDIGIDYAIDFASHFGFAKQNLPHTLSLALGSLSVSPLDLTAAYAVFANGGFKIEPYIIDHITDGSGKILLQSKPITVCHTSNQANQAGQSCNSKDPELIAPRVIPEDIAFLMNSALQGVIQHGTAQAAKVLNRNDIAGKTGTTNDQVDAWFAGYTPDLVTTTWIGFDTPHPLHEYAANLALPLWIDFMKVALKSIPQHVMQPPDNIVSVRINPKNGLMARNTLPNAITEYFRESEVPPADHEVVIAQKQSSTTDEALPLF